MNELTKWVLGIGKRPKKLRIRALHDEVIILRDTEAQQTKSGLHIPSTAKLDKKLPTGVVLSVGPGRMLKTGKRMPLDVRKGDRVCFYWEATRAIGADEEGRVVSVKEDAICGVFDD